MLPKTSSQMVRKTGAIGLAGKHGVHTLAEYVFEQQSDEVPLDTRVSLVVR